jgi:hypothetical protein
VICSKVSPKFDGVLITDFLPLSQIATNYRYVDVTPILAKIQISQVNDIVTGARYEHPVYKKVMHQ